MLGRRLLQDFMIASPLIMLASIAIQARIATPSFEPYAYSPETHRQLLAYQPYIRQIRIARTSPRDGDHEQLVRNTARMWTEGFRTGKLKPYFMTNALDSSRDGVKGQIRYSADSLMGLLISCAAANLESDNKKALDLIRISFQVSSSVKNIDVDSIGYFSMRERSALRVAEQVFGKCDADDCRELLKIVELARSNRKELERAIEIADISYVRDGERWQEDRSPLLDPLFTPNRTLASNTRSVTDSSVVAALGTTFTSQVNTVAYTLESVEAEEKLLDELQLRIEAFLELRTRS